MIVDTTQHKTHHKSHVVLVLSKPTKFVLWKSSSMCWNKKSTLIHPRLELNHITRPPFFFSNDVQNLADHMRHCTTRVLDQYQCNCYKKRHKFRIQ